MPVQLFKNARIVDGSLADLPDPVDFAVEDGRFVEVGTSLSLNADTTMDLGGAVVMPGLIDCHVHVSMVSGNLALSAALPNTWVAHKTAQIMKGMLMRGFTTVRDMGGADWGICQAQRDGLFDGPRVVMCGKALSQTGGHNDYRQRYDTAYPQHYEKNLGSMGRIVDGVDSVRQAAREEIKGGAEFLKVMADGGVSSPSDPIGYLVFSRDELKAIAEVADGYGTYVAGHLYCDEAIQRALDCGIGCVEHGNLASDDTIARMAREGVPVVPTNITLDIVSKMGTDAGMEPAAMERAESIRGAGLERTAKWVEAGVTLGFGTDLLGDMHSYQSDEFLIRANHLPTHTVIRSATLDAAKVLRKEGEIGVIAAGAHADFIVVSGNPLEDISVLTDQGSRIDMIVQGGVAKKKSAAL
ncbi:MAG: amidohydrolase family protein [Roseovarius sp.]